MRPPISSGEKSVASTDTPWPNQSSAWTSPSPPWNASSTAPPGARTRAISASACGAEARSRWIWRDRDSTLVRPRLGDERGLAIEPGARRLELRAQAEQRRLVAEARHELDGDGEAFGAPAQRQHERGLAREVEPHGEGRECKYPPPIFFHVVHHHVDPAELDRERCEPRRQ